MNAGIINEKLEKVLTEAFEFYEQGKPVTEILNLYPNYYRKELDGMFQSIQTLAAAKTGLVPPKKLLVKIVESVTNTEKNRYLHKEAKGRPFVDIIKHQISNFMTWNWKVAMPIGVVAVLVAVISYSQIGTKAPGVTEKPKPNSIVEESLSGIAEEKQAVLPPATGNVEDAVDAVLAMIENEQSILDEDESDAALVMADSQAISDFGQSYNENEF